MEVFVNVRKQMRSEAETNHPVFISGKLLFLLHDINWFMCLCFQFGGMVDVVFWELWRLWIPAREHFNNIKSFKANYYSSIESSVRL